MPSKCTLRSRSTNSLVRHSLPTNPRERSARSVRNTTPPSMVHRRRTCTRSPHPRNAGGNCISARANAFNATLPRQYPQYRRPRRERIRSPCTVMRTSASQRISTTPITSRPTRNPIPTGIIHSGPSTSITVWVPTRIRLLMGPGSTKMFRATFPSSVGSSRPRVCAARTSGRRRIS